MGDCWGDRFRVLQDLHDTEKENKGAYEKLIKAKRFLTEAAGSMAGFWGVKQDRCFTGMLWGEEIDSANVQIQTKKDSWQDDEFLCKAPENQGYIDIW